MAVPELRDPEEARRFLLQGLWLQRVHVPAAATVRPVLEWALEAAAGGQPLLPLGFVADLGHLVFDGERGIQEGPVLPGVPSGLLRTYEDHVLGKLFTDSSFARSADAMRRYQGRDRARALAFLLNQLRERSGCAGVELGPSVIKAILENPPEDALTRGWEMLERDGLHPLLIELYRALLTGVRGIAELLGPEDVFELEHGTALDELGQRLALRQVLQAAERLERPLPRHPPRTSARRQDVPTHLLEEDTYPVGGYSSLSSRGSIESLLHSQLAYMEKDERPDLFDMKYLRDELLYYARDENQFLRQRRAFVIALYPDLVQARFKDAGLPWQRGVLLLGLLTAAVRRLGDWLSTEALTFLFLFVNDDETEPLVSERKTLETVLREPIANGTVILAPTRGTVGVARQCAERARRSRCDCLLVSVGKWNMEAEHTIVTRVQLNGPIPLLNGETTTAEDPLEAWGLVLLELLRGLV